jgi:hypothetical protein
MVWLLAVRLVVAGLVASPPVRVTGLPKFVPSMTNCTVPVGVPLPGAVTLTVAVKLTLWPANEGLTEESTTVLVVPLATIWVRAKAVLLEKLASPV